VQSESRKFSRRSLLAATTLGVAGVALTACSARQGTPGEAVSVTTTTTINRATTAAETSAPSSAPAGTTTAPAPTTSAPPQNPAASTGGAHPAPAGSTPVSATAAPAATGAPVHIRLYQNDGQTYGIGMPIIVYLSKRITDGKPFAAATTVTVNGQKVDGAWFFQKSGIYPDYPLEAHYRTEKFWPAHATISLALPAQGISAGKSLIFNDGLTLTMKTGAANITTVDGATERLIVTSDGQPKFNFPVSLGKATTPTFTGTKIVMERNRVKRMIGTTPGDLYDLQVPWSVRITNSGEFIHAASWNGGNIGQRSTSNGCTNLNVTDAQNYFTFARVGDVALYRNTGGDAMPEWDGYGDWNTPWPLWRRGGVVATT
jgi:lipoprotein-anchoring transpeptidase ErfK/SrfK